jgi:hypothetical protein
VATSRIPALPSVSASSGVTCSITIVDCESPQAGQVPSSRLDLTKFPPS